MRKFWRAAAVTVVASLGLTFGGGAAAAVAAPPAVVSSVQATVPASQPAVSLPAAAPAADPEPAAEAGRYGVISAIKKLIKKFPDMVKAVKKGYSAFKAWYDKQNPFVKAAVRAVSPALTLYEIYELIRDLV